MGFKNAGTRDVWDVETVYNTGSKSVHGFNSSEAAWKHYHRQIGKAIATGHRRISYVSRPVKKTLRSHN